MTSNLDLAIVFFFMAIQLDVLELKESKFLYMDVSKNRGTQHGCFIMENLKTLLKWVIWWYHYFWKHPHAYMY